MTRRNFFVKLFFSDVLVAKHRATIQELGGLVEELVGILALKFTGRYRLYRFAVQ